MSKTVNMDDGDITNSIYERKEKKKKELRTPDNIKFGDMPADFRKRYLQMMREQAQ